MCYKYAPLVVFLATIGIISGCKYLIHFGIISYDSVVNISFIFSSVFLGLKSVNLLIKMAKKMTYKNKISCSPFLNQCVEIRKCESGLKTWDLRLPPDKTRRLIAKNFSTTLKEQKTLSYFHIFSGEWAYIKNQSVEMSSKLSWFQANCCDFQQKYWKWTNVNSYESVVSINVS